MSVLRAVAVITSLALAATGHVSAQAFAWVGSRGYHGGPEATSEGETLNLRPTELNETGLEVRIGLHGPLSMGLSASYFTAAYGAVGESAVVAARGVLDGHSFRVPIAYRLASFHGVNSLSVIVEPGIESMKVLESPTERRFVVSGGIELHAGLWRRLGLGIRMGAGTLSSSSILDEDLPEGFKNHNYWWSSLRIGIAVR